MILFHPENLIPAHNRSSYRILRAIMFAIFAASAAVFAYRTLFPTQPFSFSFRNPDTSENTLEDPVDGTGKTVRHGRIPVGGTVTTYAGTVGTFSNASVRIVLDTDSTVPKSGLKVAIRKSYRSFYYPEGEPLSTQPQKRVITAGGKPYLFSTDALYPFVSDRAALSWSPKERILAGTPELLSIFPPREEERVGFRPGTLVSDAQGVYAIDGDEKAHPIGNTEVFSALGFHWDDVIKADEEELGFHKRGRILLFDGAQPDGTLFRDTVSGSYSVVSDGRRLPISDRDSLERLLGVTTPIDASSDSLLTAASCELRRTPLSFLHPTYRCDIPLGPLSTFPGDSFSISLTSDETIHAADFSVTLETKPDRSNFSLFLARIRERFSATYGSR
ncbi:MAG: hypothetical protein HGA38_02460 [Candidatus Moranbacteria bacterium]|nr:hypothetical protein [Candidatus Moranbacteria bacterium]NTW45750.1 hypothetical protein [Candidatus Moranbacteria bacterium]